MEAYVYAPLHTAQKPQQCHHGRDKEGTSFISAYYLRLYTVLKCYDLRSSKIITHILTVHAMSSYL
jgi:hypothetical protein